MPELTDDEKRKAKIEALRQLRDSGFYEPETDNPEGLNLDENPENTMQADPTNLLHALKQKSRKDQLDELLRQAKQ